MRILLKTLIAGLLLVLIVAVGIEVVALHHDTMPVPPYPTATLVVRKATCTAAPLKTVRPAVKGMRSE